MTTFGTPNNDTLLGTESNDSLDGLAGDDSLRGLGGADLLTGAGGNDTLEGGAGDDTLVGNAGADWLSGGSGNDSLDGGPITDRINFVDGNTLFYGDVNVGLLVDLSGITGDDDTATVRARNPADDSVVGIDTVANINTVQTGSGNDSIVGTRIVGNFEMYLPGAGNDTIDGGELRDPVTGRVKTARVSYDNQGATQGIVGDLQTGQIIDGFGDTDTIRNVNQIRGTVHGDSIAGTDATDWRETFEMRGGNDTIDGRGGIDVVRYDAAPSAIDADLQAGVVRDGYGGIDTLRNVEGVFGSRHDDTLRGSDNPSNVEVFRGNAGNDLIDGRGGIDRIDYTTATSGISADLSIGRVQDGQGGVDTVVGIENVEGSAFDDFIVGNAQSNVLLGGAGNDRILVGVAVPGVTDGIDGGLGEDTVVVDGMRAEFAVAPASTTIAGLPAAGWELTHLVNGYKVRVFGVERVEFLDQTVLVADLENGENRVGTQGNDTLVSGALGNSRLDGLGGNDSLVSAGGNDLLLGGEGDDTLRGNNGDDTLLGGAGVDRLEGGAGNDLLDGGAIQDRLNFTDGNTASYAGFTAGVLVDLRGVTGDGSQGSGSVRALDPANEALVGNDTLVSINVIQTGAGNDSIVGSNVPGYFEMYLPGAGNDNIDGGVLRDPTTGAVKTARVSYDDGLGDRGINADLQSGVITDHFGNVDQVSNINQLRGTRFNDTLLGTNASDWRETFDARGGNDFIDGRGGVDIARYDFAPNAVEIDLSLSSGQVIQDGYGGTDTLVGIEGVYGSSNNDTLLGSNRTDEEEVFRGGAGNDLIDGRGGADRVEYSAAFGAVFVNLAVGRAQDGQAGDDTLIGIEHIAGSTFNDGITGDAQDNRLRGGAGNDTLTGAGGNDSLDGQEGNDSLNGGGGNDTLAGGEGNDALNAGSGDDVLRTWGGGSDTLAGGDGQDVVEIDGIRPEDLTVTLGTGGLRLQHASGLNLTINDGVETFRFSFSGTELTYAQLLALFNLAVPGASAPVTLVGGPGNDVLRGNAGDDLLVGEGGIDTLVGGAGNDSLLGGAGADTLVGEAGNDTINGGLLLDRLNYTDGNTLFYGGVTVGLQVDLSGISGDGSVGSGTVRARNPADDSVVGIDTVLNISFVQTGSGDDSILGTNAPGNFEMYTPGAGNDTINGGTLRDAVTGLIRTVRLNYDTDDATQGINADLRSGVIIDGMGNTDIAIRSVTDNTTPESNLSTVNQIRGTRFDDSIAGTDAHRDWRETFEVRGGNDTVDGRGGLDVVRYDFAPGAIEADLALASGQIIRDGYGGTDTLIRVEGVYGSAHNDTLRGSEPTDSREVWRGGAGDDLIDGRGGNDRIEYTGATAGVEVSLLSGRARDGQGGVDTLIGIEEVDGSSFNDFIEGGLDSNYIRGQAGDDRILVGVPQAGARDTIEGGAGTDTVVIDALRSEFAVAPVTISGAAGWELTHTNGYKVAFVGVETVEFFDQVLRASDLGNTTPPPGGNPGAFNGTSGNDLLVAGSVIDAFMLGFEGNDTLRGGAGDDFLEGGSGNDRLEGGAQRVADLVSYRDLDSRPNGTPGVNVNLATGTSTNAVLGTDTLVGIEGVRDTRFNDTITGSGGNDLFFLSGGNDSVSGGLGADTVLYEDATRGVTINLATGRASATGDTTVGALGVDTLVGIEGANGSPFDDLITLSTVSGFAFGRGGDDSITGGNGNDYLNGGSGNDTLVGGAGIDTVAYDNLSVVDRPGDANLGVYVDLDNRFALDNWNDIDQLNGIENVTGSALGDQLFGDGAANVLDGGLGNDVLDGAGGNDSLLGRDGDDLFITSAGRDTVVGGGGNDTLSIAANMADVRFAVLSPGVFSATRVGDTVNGVTFSEVEQVQFLDGVKAINELPIGTVGATDGPNTLIGTSLADTLVGLGGDDRLDGRQGADLLVGGTGNDTYVVDVVADRVAENPDEGYDRIEFSPTVGGLTYVLPVHVEAGQILPPNSTLAGSLTGNDLANDLRGNAGANTLAGGAGDDWLVGGGGNDRLVGDGHFWGDTVSYRTVSVAGPNNSGVSVSLQTGLAVGSTLVGGSGTDTLIGIEHIDDSPYNDTLVGNAERNWVRLSGGNDRADGGAGLDVLMFDGGFFDTFKNAAVYDVTSGVAVDLQAGTATGDAIGNDTVSNFEAVHGSWFNDRITLTDLNEGGYVFGRGGNDTLIGGAGNNVFFGGLGNDSIDGRGGRDTVIYRDEGFESLEPISSLSGAFVNLSTGLATDIWGGRDTLTGIEDVVGSRGNDTLIGNAASNELEGGEGDDVLDGGVDASSWKVFVLDGGSDTDLGDFVYYQDAGSGVDANLFTGLSVSDTEGRDTLLNIENLEGSEFADVLVGDGRANMLIGNGGNDSLAGGADDDYLLGGLGNDTLDGGAGSLDIADYFFSGGGAGVQADLQLGMASGGMGSDRLLGVEGINGSDFADRIEGDGQGNWLRGNGGNDLINGRDGNDTLQAGTGQDTVQGGVGNDVLELQGGVADYTFTVVDAASLRAQDRSGNTVTFSGIETVSFLGDEVLRSEAELRAALSGNGSGSQTGTEGADSLRGSAAGDLINGRGGNDTLDGQAGADTLIGGLGDDEYRVDNALDRLVENAGEGRDTAVVEFATASVFTLGANIDNAVVRSAATLAVGLQGNELDNRLEGNGAANVIVAGAGNDTLVGGLGADTLNGGEGNDVYVLDATTDTVIEAGNGIDEIRIEYSGTAAAVFNMAANVDHLTVVSSAASLTLNGNVLNNIITGLGVRAETLAGGDGNDTLWGGEGTAQDLIDGGGGTDTVSLTGTLEDYVLSKTGTNFSDIQVRHQTTGQVTILRNVEFLQFGTSTEAGFVGKGDAVLLTDRTGLLPTSGNDLLSGRDDVDEEIEGLAGNDTLRGNGGNDTLLGGDGLDRLEGGAGNDLLDGGLGADVYAFSRLDGLDVIDQNDTVAANIDTVEIVDGTSRSDLVLERGYFSYDDLVIRLGRSDDVAQVVVSDFFRNDAINNAGAIDQIRLTLGTSSTGDDVLLSRAQIAAAVLLGDSDDNTLLGYVTTNDVMRGEAGNDVLLGSGGADTLHGGDGADALYGGLGTDSLLGDAGADLLVGGDGNDVLRPGAERLSGQVDTLSGGAGSDTYWFEGSAGGILVSEPLLPGAMIDGGSWAYPYVDGTGDVPRSSDFDVVRFEAGILPTQVGWSRDGGDLLITVAGREATMRVQGFFTSSINPIESFVFATGASLSAAAVRARVMQPTAGDDRIIGTAANDLLSGLGGSDTLEGAAGNDTLDGGDGSDLLLGGLGNDQYRVGLAPGHLDVLVDEGGTDRIVLSSNMTLNPAFVSFARLNQGDVLVEYNGAPAAVIAGALNNVAARIESVQVGGSVITVDYNQAWSWPQRWLPTIGSDRIELGPNNDTLDGFAGDDTLYGWAGNDTLSGGRGNDKLVGGVGNDTLIASAGTDTLIGGNEWVSAGTPVYVDTFVFNADATGTYWVNNQGIAGVPSDRTQGLLQFNEGVSFDRDDVSFVNNLIRIELSNQGVIWLDPDHDWSIRFGEADTVSLASLLPQVAVNGTSTSDWLAAQAALPARLDGLAGNDTLIGGNLADELIGGVGDDSLVGGTGRDVYVFRSGWGLDVINDLQGGVLRFEGLNADDVRFEDNGSRYTYNEHLVITERNNPGSELVVRSWFLVPGTPDVFVFDDLTLSYSDAFARSLNATLGNDKLDDSWADDVIAGLDGNDVIQSLQGRDTIYGGNGDDRITGSGQSMPLVFGGAGNDDLSFSGFAEVHDGTGADYIYDDGASLLVLKADGDIDTLNSFNRVDAVSRIVFADLRSDQLQFARSEDSLHVSANGLLELVIRDWYQGFGRQVDQIFASDGKVIARSTLATIEPSLIGVNNWVDSPLPFYTQSME